MWKYNINFSKSVYEVVKGRHQWKLKKKLGTASKSAVRSNTSKYFSVACSITLEKN